MFRTETKHGVPLRISDALDDPAIVHGFSTRLGGVSPAPWDSLNLDDRRGDDLSNVQENFRRLCAALDVDVQRIVLSRQVHRDDVRTVTADDCGKGLWRMQDYDSADALITDETDIPLVVFSADCNVILLHDPVRRAIGAAHAGWRGTALGIAAKAVRAMADAYGCDPSDIRAAVGPDYPVLFRFNTCDYVEGGIELPEAIVMAKMLEEAGVDALHCTQGMFASKQAIIAPGFVPVMHYAENAAAIKRSVKIPVLAVGRYNDIYMSEAMLRDEKADFIVMARASLADPELPNKAKAGKTEEIIHCIGCNQGCTGETAVGEYPVEAMTYFAKIAANGWADAE